jgi:hypothetical protein
MAAVPSGLSLIPLRIIITKRNSNYKLNIVVFTEEYMLNENMAKINDVKAMSKLQLQLPPM